MVNFYNSVYKKVSYKEYINSLSNPDCTDALLRVYPKINIRNINEFINNMDEISDIRKEFYNIMLQKRYELILTPAYEKAIDILNTKNVRKTDYIDDDNMNL